MHLRLMGGTKSFHLTVQIQKISPCPLNALIWICPCTLSLPENNLQILKFEFCSYEGLDGV